MIAWVPFIMPFFMLVRHCQECGVQISVDEYTDNDGLCDECASEEE